VVEALREPEFEALEPEADAGRAVDAIAHPPRRGVRWGFVALSTGGGLVALWLNLTLDYLVRGLFSWVGWLGWLGVALGCACFIAVAAVIGRELAGLFRLKQLARLRLKGDEAALKNDRDAAVRTLRSLITLYGDRPETARGRRLVAAHLGEIIDGRDLLILAERDLIAPLDICLGSRAVGRGGHGGQSARRLRRRLRAVGKRPPDPRRGRPLWQPAWCVWPHPIDKGRSLIGAPGSSSV